MRFQKCNNCGKMIRRKTRHNEFCSIMCKKEFDKNLKKEDEEWFDKLLLSDLKEKRGKDYRIIRR